MNAIVNFIVINAQCTHTLGIQLFLLLLLDLHVPATLPSIVLLPAAASSGKWAGWQDQEGTEFRHNL